MKCAICKDEIEGEGYSTQPFFKDTSKKCCEGCSGNFVHFAKTRIGHELSRRNEDEQLQDEHKNKVIEIAMDAFWDAAHKK